MFSGIIHNIGTIISAEKRGDLRLVIACDFADAKIGESIAVSGACLTVVGISPLPLREGLGGGVTLVPPERGSPPTLPSPSRGEGLMLAFEVSGETISRTAARWNAGDKVNLERSLKLGDRLDGHLVTGHVDGTAKMVEIKKLGDSHALCLEAPAPLARYIAEKGSVTLDGVSLTVNKVEGTRFFVNIIPHTWGTTTLGERGVGEAVNVEIDLIARYVERLVQK